MTTSRSEAEIFADLATLCTESGFAHAVAFFCLRDNTIVHSGSLTGEDVAASYLPSRLIRTEITTLVGLMLNGPLNLCVPRPPVLKSLVDRTEGLLAELHESLNFWNASKWTFAELADGKKDPFADADTLREPIFYGGESAYDFQYRDLSLKKYRGDTDWLTKNKGFSINEAAGVFDAIAYLQLEKLNNRSPPRERIFAFTDTALSAFIFNVDEICKTCPFSAVTITAILNAFTAPTEGGNATFKALNDFNIVSARPILKINANEFLAFQTYALCQALYEAPFYWMNEDKRYRDTALEHRGNFTEDFCYERLCRVFGQDHVHRNVKIRDGQGRDISEIDVLVKFAHIAVVVQAKSKRLTLAAQKGNDGVLKSDFQKAVQSAYDQGLVCAEELLAHRHRWYDQEGNELAFASHFRKTLIVCVVSDHYPALAFQCAHLLEYTSSDAVPAPFVTDVFTLDIITEMLDTPIYCLDYIVKRTSYFDKISISHELTALAYHLKLNLWFDDKVDYVHIEDDFGTDLDVALAVRRRGIHGRATPEGVLTKFVNKAVGRLIRDIELFEHPATTNLAFLLLSLSEETLNEISEAVDKLRLRSHQYGRGEDVTLLFRRPPAGLTVHINDDDAQIAQARLAAHCEVRKYKQKASQWFGLCISARDLSPRFGVEMSSPWTFDAEREKAFSKFVGKPAIRSLRKGLTQTIRKIGRNDPCPCGSGLKYKRCHLNKTH